MLIIWLPKRQHFSSEQDGEFGRRRRDMGYGHQVVIWFVARCFNIADRKLAEQKWFEFALFGWSDGLFIEKLGVGCGLVEAGKGVGEFAVEFGLDHADVVL